MVQLDYILNKFLFKKIRMKEDSLPIDSAIKIFAKENNMLITTDPVSWFTQRFLNEAKSKYEYSKKKKKTSYSLKDKIKISKARRNGRIA
jgi:hypothetical protein